MKFTLLYCMQEFIEHIPIATTLFSIYFAYNIINHYQAKPSKYVLWWTIGVLTFGAGTLAESINALFGFNTINLKYWYIVGALLGGFPLAQGSVYLLMNKKFANVAAVIVVTIVAVASVFVILTPVALPNHFDGKLTGKVFEWTWVRLFSPFINIYSFIFLVGGAIYSAFYYFKKANEKVKFKSNILIAIGALLPGIGGTFTRMGYVEVLYITEFIGLILIFLGYSSIKNYNRQNVSFA
ncbi:MAG: hypothetical protein JXQ87_16735 [Bacteroidia bacterium]